MRLEVDEVVSSSEFGAGGVLECPFSAAWPHMLNTSRVLSLVNTFQQLSACDIVAVGT